MQKRFEGPARRAAILLWAGAIALLLAAARATAGGLEVKAGSWEMQSTTVNPMTGAPETLTVTECVDGQSMDPEAFLNNTEGCSVADVQTSSTAMSWTMSCHMPGGQMKGRAKVNTSGGGKQVAGSMELTASFNGQTMNFSTQWSGRWVGPCS